MGGSLGSPILPSALNAAPQQEPHCGITGRELWGLGFLFLGFLQQGCVPPPLAPLQPLALGDSPCCS